MYTVNKPVEGNGENVPITREDTFSSTFWFAKTENLSSRQECTWCPSDVLYRPC